MTCAPEFPPQARRAEHWAQTAAGCECVFEQTSASVRLSLWVRDSVCSATASSSLRTRWDQQRRLTGETSVKHYEKLHGHHHSLSGWRVGVIDLVIWPFLGACQRHGGTILLEFHPKNSNCIVLTNLFIMGYKVPCLDPPQHHNDTCMSYLCPQGTLYRCKTLTFCRTGGQVNASVQQWLQEPQQWLTQRVWKVFLEQWKHIKTVSDWRSMIHLFIWCINKQRSQVLSSNGETVFWKKK